MQRFIRWYGAGPLHLVALIACFVIAGYAAARLIPANPSGITKWFVGAAIAHDLLLFPAYSLVDRALTARNGRHPPAGVTWINHIRVPACLSGLLLLVWFPIILRKPPGYRNITTFSTAPYLRRWLLVTASLFALSAAIYLARLIQAHSRGPMRRSQAQADEPAKP